VSERVEKKQQYETDEETIHSRYYASVLHLYTEIFLSRLNVNCCTSYISSLFFCRALDKDVLCSGLYLSSENSLKSGGIIIINAMASGSYII
jgi:isocitrate dehydrogenase kinase/phosphatase